MNTLVTDIPKRGRTECPSGSMEVVLSSLEQVDEQAWNQRLKASDEATSRQTTYDARRIRDYLRAEPFFLEVCDGGEVKGQMVFYKCFKYWAPLLSRPFLSKMVLPRLRYHFQQIFWDFGPVVFAPDQREQILKIALEAVLSVVHRERVMYIEALPDLVAKSGELRPETKRIFEAAGFTTEDVGTISLFLDQPLEKLWRALDGRLRRKIRRAERDGVTIEPVRNEQDLADYADIMLQTYRRNGLVERPGRWLDLFYENFITTDYIGIYLARLSGRPLAGQLIEQFNGNAYLAGVSLANEALSQRIPANELLQWEMIKRCKEGGMRFVDWGGYVLDPRNEKDESINRFKKKWGGQVRVYNRYSKVVLPGQFRLIRKVRDIVLACRDKLR